MFWHILASPGSWCTRWSFAGTCSYNGSRSVCLFITCFLRTTIQWIRWFALLFPRPAVDRPPQLKVCTVSSWTASRENWSCPFTLPICGHDMCIEVLSSIVLCTLYMISIRPRCFAPIWTSILTIGINFREVAVGLRATVTLNGRRKRSVISVTFLPYGTINHLAGMF